MCTGSVFEDMAKMRVATTTTNLDAAHSVTGVLESKDVCAGVFRVE